MQKLSLPELTLCCVDTTGRIPMSLQGIQRCMEQVAFGDAVLLTTPELLHGQKVPTTLRIVPIAPIRSIEEYSLFILKSLSRYVSTSHCLIVQWDGFVIDAGRWTDDFLQYDYIGAPWRDVDPEIAVGNGGFSLRSKRLLVALESDSLVAQHPEDVCICKQHRKALENQGIRFAEIGLARRFSVEDGEISGNTFGFHGPRHLPAVLGPESMVGFIKSFSPEKLLFSNLFDMLLRELTSTAARNRDFEPALQALTDVIQKALTDYKASAIESEYSLTIAKALVRYGQYEAAQILLRYRTESCGFNWTNLKLWIRLHTYRLMALAGLRN